MHYAIAFHYAQLAYTSLFYSEDRFLEHVFFGAGSGYQWKNGQAVSVGDTTNPEDDANLALKESIRNHEQSLKRAKEWNPPDNNPSWKNPLLRVQAYHEKMIKLAKGPFYERLKDEIEDGCAAIVSLEKRNPEAACYFETPLGYATKIWVSQLSLIANIPDDIKTDWLVAAKKALWYLDIGLFIIRDSEEQGFIDQAREKIKQIEIARQKEIDTKRT